MIGNLEPEEKVLDNSTVRDYLITLLKEKCYRKGEYILSSGEKSEHYVNCKPLTLSGEGLTIISMQLLECIPSDTVAVAGLTLGADPLVSGVAVVSNLQSRKLDGLIVRKEPKGHGTQAWIEGPLLPKGSKVVVLEDVITTGGSALKAVDKLRDAGYIVETIITIVDRQEAGINMADSGIDLISLFQLKELI
jgi:orotate phosphoribosyltransferase